MKARGDRQDHEGVRYFRNTIEDKRYEIKNIADTIMEYREEAIATLERRADEAAAAGDEEWSAAYRAEAAEHRAYRFFWERERQAA